MAKRRAPGITQPPPGNPAAGLLPQQPAEAVVEFDLGQESLGICGCKAGTVRRVAVEHQSGGVEQKLFRGCARVHGKELKPGALIEIEAKVHMLNVSAQQGGFNRTVVIVSGAFRKVKHPGAAPIGNTADCLDLNGGRKRL
jgi:hypothetical protein